MEQPIRGAGEFLLLLEDFGSLVGEYTRRMVQEPIETVNKLGVDNLERNLRQTVIGNLRVAREEYVAFLESLEDFFSRISTQSSGFFPRRHFERPPAIAEVESGVPRS